MRLVSEKTESTMFRLKLKPNQAAITLLAVLVLGTVILILNAESSHFITEVGHRTTSPVCPVKHERKEQVVNLAWLVSSELTDLRVDHALCYDSLIGALKYGRLLPTQDHVDFCIMDTDYIRVFSMFTDKLSKSGLNFFYNSSHGEFIISRGRHSSSPDVAITVFYICGRRHACRAGVARWLLSFFNGDSLDAFPRDLLKGPLKNLTFQGKPMPVPNGDAEILKSFYPTDWWNKNIEHVCPNVTLLPLQPLPHN
ncbi:hypothetical protein RRG08_036020 [Elysia crispata]|uniref:Uncharacterized protein n=1 Tax=Elysia crispata TaxID=231223 RepID=A0AAE1AL19_9GAST|nr:hypothetical protein RRG08_036020 [Elysia crispata]